MSDTFDPYCQWLGIPPAEQPPDYYRLLGAPRFSENVGELARAADERIAAVTRFQEGPHREYVPRLVAELSMARSCLTNPATKAAYDAQLRQQFGEPHAVAMSRFAAPDPSAWGDPGAAPPALYPPPAPPVMAPTAPAPVVVEPWADSETDEEPSPTRLGQRLAFVMVVLVVGLAVGWAIVQGPLRPPQQSERSSEEPPLALAEDDSSLPKDAPRGTASSDEGGVVIMPEADRTIRFLAETATIHGENARLELRQADGVITNWLTADDWLSWEFRVLEPGFFEVEIVYAASNAMAGGRYTVAVEGQEVTRSIDSTGGVETFGRETFYWALTRNGRHTLTIRPEQISDAGLMIFKSLRLKPVARREAN